MGPYSSKSLDEKLEKSLLNEEASLWEASSFAVSPASTKNRLASPQSLSRMSFSTVKLISLKYLEY